MEHLTAECFAHSTSNTFFSLDPNSQCNQPDLPRHGHPILKGIRNQMLSDRFFELRDFRAVETSMALEENVFWR